MTEAIQKAIAAALAALPSILTFLAGFATAIFAEPIRNALFGARLKIEFSNDPEFVTETPEVHDSEIRRARFVRVRVTNKGLALAKACRGYLTSVERRDGNIFVRTGYCDSIPLPWSYGENSGHEAIDLAKDIPHYVNVLSTRRTSGQYRFEIRPQPFRYAGLAQAPATYRFTIHVSGDGVRPKSKKIRFEWRGKWDDFAVEEC